MNYTAPAMKQIHIQTRERTQFVDITHAVRSAVRQSGISTGTVELFVPHTTAGITINENADPDVLHDLTFVFDDLIAWDHPAYRHAEGNTAAHVKAGMMGASTRVWIENGALQLGTWQAIYFCEFDGPRSRTIWIRTTE